jgi:hypothetical protein
MRDVDVDEFDAYPIADIEALEAITLGHGTHKASSGFVTVTR